MKVQVFELAFSNGNHTIGRNRSEYTIDLLPAYAIEVFSINVNGMIMPGTPDVMVLRGNKATWQGQWALASSDNLILTIYYHGIRDYEALFPRVTNPDLKMRLAEFYIEAEIAFENKMRLAFCLMCGAIFEGLLFDRNPTGKFYDKINAAQTSGSITPDVASIMHNTRTKRNLIHASNFASPFVSHTEMMDMRTTLDKLIMDF